MIDHVALAVTDLERSRRFYDAVLAPLGIKSVTVNDRGMAYERDGRDDFIIIRSDTRPVSPRGSHTCFSVPTLVVTAPV
ncbi:MAG TPA: hypothetical protein VEZ24_16130 [Microvirga sp.]|nr:hypothetical protein [Microvirga sp.]